MSTHMTREEFKNRWESSEDGGGITWDDIADVAKVWGLYQTPRIHPMSDVLSAVLQAAGCECESDSDDYCDDRTKHSKH